MRLCHQLLPLLPLFTSFAAMDCPAATLLTVDATGAVAAPTTGYLRLGTTSSPSGHSIDTNSRYLLRDGKPWLPVMGEFHYTRVPAQDWDAELADGEPRGEEGT